MAEIKGKKVALVHDFLVNYGGAERVLEVLSEMFPEAPIYTLVHDAEKMRGKFADRVIHTSFLQKFPRFWRTRLQWLLPFLPSAPETFDLRDYDLVISSSGAWVKGIVTKLSTIHIAYIHSPMRFVWDYHTRYLTEVRKSSLGWIVRPMLSYIRIWDRQAADRPDFLIANSKYTQARIEKYYRRKSEVVYPPVVNNQTSNTNNQTIFNDSNSNDKKVNEAEKLKAKSYFLVVSRLSEVKRVDVAIEAFNKLQLPLIVVGEGRGKRKLERLAGPTVKLVGWRSDEVVNRLCQGARALIFPSLDDFGLVAAEAMSFGTPVIALKKGGATEIVDQGVNGEFFEAQTPEAVVAAVRKFMEQEGKYDSDVIRKSVERLSKERFVAEIREYILKITNN